MGARDPKGFYKALNVGPAASQTEIRLAYKFLKRAYRDGRKMTNIGKIQSAYHTLSDPELRAQYDGIGAPSEPAKRSSRLNSIPLLAGVSVLLLVAVWISFGPAIMARWVTFEVGEQLVWKQTSKRLGEVVDYEAQHDFPEAPAQAAYAVRVSSGAIQWFPAADLHHGAKKR